jgi:hypothetical protein
LPRGTTSYFPFVRLRDTLLISWRWSAFASSGSDKVDIDKWDNQRMLLKCFTYERTAWVDGFTLGKLDANRATKGAASCERIGTG